MSLFTITGLQSLKDMNLSFNTLGDVSIRAVFSQSLIRFVTNRKEVTVNVQGMGVEGIDDIELKRRIVLFVVCSITCLGLSILLL